MKTFLAALLALAALSSFAQQPSISGVNRTSGSNHNIVTITGNGFGSNAAQLAVFFGATKVKTTDIVSVSDQILEVRIPPAATYDKISVINTSSKLAAYGNGSFLYSFGGDHGFDPAKLDGQADFQAGSGLFDICTCDFDGDGRTDIAAANTGITNINIFENTTTAPGIGNVNFNSASATFPLVQSKTIHIICGDLNGDGKPDLAFTEEGVIASRIYVYQNNSTTGVFLFTKQQEIDLIGTNTVVKQLKIADLDKNGRPEIVVTNQSSNNIKIFNNQTTGTNIAMSATPITIEVGSSTTDALSVDDLNGDGLPEIMAGPFLTATNYVHILPNKSTPGNISFDNVISLLSPQPIASIKSGDLDHDGKPDIAVTLPSNNQVGIYLNTGSGTNISFGAPVLTFVAGLPYGLDFGDLDGDGKTDIVVGTITATSLTILNNESTPGNLSFQKTTKPATYITRNVKIGDLDGDAKPDIAFVSADKSGVPASQVSVFINKTCVKPDVTPKGPHNICAGFQVKLETANIPGTTYEWKRDVTTSLGTGPAASYTVTANTGDYTVTATSPGCSYTSTPVHVTVGPPATSSATIDDDSPICIGSPLQLRVLNGTGGETYTWSGPQNYTSSSAPVTVTANFQQGNAGRYFLDVHIGGCVAKTVSTVIDAIPAPNFKVNSGSATIICAPATQTLSVDPPAISAYTYEWFRNSGSINTGPSHNATTSGVYHFKATPVNPGCAVITSNDVTITFAMPPSVAFDLPPSPNCVGENIEFANRSVTDPAATASYLWELTSGSPATSTDISASTKYLSPGNFGVKLTVSYNNSTSCTVVSAPTTIAIQPAPPVTITTTGNQTSFCPGESLELKVTGSFTGYEWNTNETTSAIVVSAPGTYDVDVTTANGCVINAFKQVTQFDAPKITVTAQPVEVPEGTTSQLTAAGLDTYTWSPAATLSNANIANPVASPVELLTVYEVSGKDSRGCTGSATIEVRVRQGSIYSKLVPSKFFSPNQDEVSEYWLIDRIEEFPGCHVTIYDDKGVKVHAVKPYHNDWDGTFNGARLPDGVYYFVIKCDDEQNSPKTGSITILR